MCTGLWVKYNQESNTEHFSDTHFKTWSLISILICIWIPKGEGEISMIKVQTENDMNNLNRQLGIWNYKTHFPSGW